MTTYLLDAKALIDDVWPEGDVAVSELTLAELPTGVHAASEGSLRAARRVRFDRLRSPFDPLPVTVSVLDAYADLEAAEIAAGRKPPRRRIDLLIAAAVRSTGRDGDTTADSLDDDAASVGTGRGRRGGFRRACTTPCTRSAAARGSSCSHTRTTCHPAAASAASVSRSRAVMLASFTRHQSALAFGRWTCTGQECQKQPSTKTATRAPRNTRSARRRRFVPGGVVSTR